MQHSYWDEDGRFVPDPVPVAKPVDFRPPPSLAERIRQAVREEISRAARDSGQESFEESDDFDVGDDYDPRSPWELDADQEVAPYEAASEKPVQPVLEASGATPKPEGGGKDGGQPG